MSKKQTGELERELTAGNLYAYHLTSDIVKIRKGLANKTKDSKTLKYCTLTI